MAKARKAQLPFISIIIINWNGRHLLKKLLPILEAQSYPQENFEIVVLDNDSTKDDSVEFIKKNYPKVVLIENTANDGFARGCNLAIAAAKGDYFMIINNDTEPDRDWLKALVECAQYEQHAGAVVSKVLFSNRGKGNIINNAGSILHPDRSWPIEEIGANKPDGPEYGKTREITALCGTSMLLSRAMLEDIGLFDETFYMYFEDADMSWRAQKAGWKFYYQPKSIVMHEHSASSKEHSDFWTFYVTRNRVLIMWKHAGFGLALRVYLVFIKDFLVKPVVLGIIGRQRRHQLRMVRLWVKINFSFLWHLPGELLRRAGLIREKQLTQ